MPLYSYRCPNGHSYDARRAVDDRDQAPCPECQEAGAKQLSTSHTLVPGHFRKHVHTTGLKATLGSGPWEEMVSRRNRWDSGYK